MSSYLERKKRFLVMGSGGWWCPPNFNTDDCICAYQFKGAGSQSDAFQDMTGHGYTLTKDDPNNQIDFDSNNGFVWQRGTWRTARALHNTSVTGIKSFVVRYSTPNDIPPTAIAYGIAGDQSNGYYAVQYPAVETGSSISTMRWLTRRSPAWNQRNFIVHYNIGSYRDGTDNVGELYIDGVKIEDSNLRSYGGYIGIPANYLFGHGTAGGNVTAFTIACGAFYSRKLTSAEISHIYEQAAGM